MFRLPFVISPLLMALTLATTGPAPAEDTPPAPLMLVLDASGSMWGQIGGENKIVIARRVLDGVVDGLDDGAEVGVIAYGHRREGDCQDIESVIPLGPLEKTAAKVTLNGLQPKGKTPITASLKSAFTALEGRAEGATVILISDGLETCGGDPCATVRAAKESGVEFLLHVVGFDVAGEDVSSLECAAQAGDGLFLSAEDADQLSEALEAAVAMPVEVPAGRLSVKVVANGALHDGAVQITDAETGEDAGGGRTYTSPETNPRLIPLADGRYQVRVIGVGMKGAVRRSFEVVIEDGGAVEKLVDFTTGELSIGVNNNGQPHDAIYSVTNLDDGSEVASGRTYTGPKQNPARVRITAGTYNVTVRPIGIGDGPKKDLGRVTVVPSGETQTSHNFVTGTLKVGASRGGELIDSTINVVHRESGKSVGGGRTYTSAKSNPKTFVLEPGSYEVTVQEIRGERTRFQVEVTAEATVEKIVDPAAAP